MDIISTKSNTIEDLPTVAGETQLDDMTTYRIALWINNHLLPGICMTGFVGNLLSLTVLLQKRNREIPCYLYLIGLAISDCVVLMLGMSLWSFAVLAPGQLTHLKCRFLAYFFQWSCLTGSLLIVFATMHKFFAFCLPSKMSRWRTVRRAFQIIVTIYIASAVYNVPYFFTAKVVNQETCIGITDMNPLTVSISWVGLVLNCIIPFALVMGMNSLIIKTIVGAENSIIQRNKHRGTARNYPDAANPTPHHGKVQTKLIQRHISKEEASYRTHKQSAVLLIVVTFAFIFLTLPLYISYLLFSFVEYENDRNTHSLLILIYHIAHKMYVTNSAINFVLYLLAGTRFRKDFIGLFLCNKPRYQTNASNTSSVSHQITSRISENIVRKYTNAE